VLLRSKKLVELRSFDTAYGAVRLLKWLVDRNITPHVPASDKSARPDGTFSRADFVFDQERNIYVCPGGAELTSTGNIDQGHIVVALTYRATVDVPARFRNSKAVGAVFGLTPSRYQSGEISRTGAISKCGDEMVRVMLYEAAQIMLMRTAKWSWLKAWSMKIARHRGMKKAIVALARRLAVIMHRLWVDGTEFRWSREVAAEPCRIKCDRRKLAFHRAVEGCPSRDDG
jgi:hypothetical protein